MALVLPRKLEERLKREAEKQGIPLEELIVEVLSKALNNPLSREDEVELHLKLAEKYLREAEDLLAKGDYVEASEKGWSAVVQVVKALATREGKEIKSHRELMWYIHDLAEKLRDPEIRYLWSRSLELHQNFYENWMHPRSTCAERC
jgi:uncharacterized protein (UPF0332 family)